MLFFGLARPPGGEKCRKSSKHFLKFCPNRGKKYKIVLRILLDGREAEKGVKITYQDMEAP